MSENIFYQAKKGFFKYAILPLLAITTSCSLNKEFVDDDLYYSPKDNFPKTETAIEDSLRKKIPVDTLEIKTINDLNYAVSQGGDANLYWSNYFNYSPYSSSLGWDYDGDGIVNAFDLQPYIPNFSDDINNNGISDNLEFGPYFYSNLDFIYWDLYYNYPSWRRNFYYDFYWNSPYFGTNINYYFEYPEKQNRENYPVRRRGLSTLVKEEKEENIRRNVPDSREKIVRDYVRENSQRRSVRYARPTERNERENYVPERNSREIERNSYSPRRNSSTRQTNTRNSSVRQRSNSNIRRSINSSTKSSGSSTKSSGTRSSKSSNSSRSGRRR